MTRVALTNGAAIEMDSLVGAIQSNANVRRSDRQSFDNLPYTRLLQYDRKALRLASPVQRIAYSIVVCGREIKQFNEHPGRKTLLTAIWSLVRLLRVFAEETDIANASEARNLARELTEGLEPLPKGIAFYLKQRGSVLQRPAPQLVGWTDQRWSQFLAGIRSANSRFALTVLGDVVEQEIGGAGTAKALRRLASRHVGTYLTMPIYDESDSHVMIEGVRIEGFRGATKLIDVDFTRKGKPTNILLFGDNGVGKSTIIDAIEFALQGRIDRSADFESSLRASPRNLAADSAATSVRLSDGTLVSRSIVVGRSGRDAASGEPIRAGFRIAPVAIRRADILRFLDTDTFSRGTVFFDYFPDPGGAVAVRPDEELRMLEEETFALRVRRAELAELLAARYPGEDRHFEDSQYLDKFVRDELFPAKGVVEFEELEDADRTMIGELLSIQRRNSAIKKKLAAGVQSLNPVAYQKQLERVRPVLESIGSNLTDSFLRITGARHISSLDVIVAQSGPVSLDVVVTFSNGKTAFPQQIFSEAYKDLVALLFFLTVAKASAEHGQAKILLFDDVFQSVDATIRVDVLSYILQEFRGWQLIITGHDRSWIEQIRALGISKGVVFSEADVIDWSFDDGVSVRSGISADPINAMRKAQESGDIQLIAGAAGILLEKIVGELSASLQCRIIRRRGDRYTLGDLWPVVRARLGSDDNLAAVCEAVDVRLHVRNALGAHFNDWAQDLPRRDVERLGEGVSHLYQGTYCEACAAWLSERGSDTAECRCGALKATLKRQ